MLTNRDDELFKEYMEEQFQPAYDILVYEGGVPHERASEYLDTCAVQGWDLVSHARHLVDGYALDAVIVPFKKEDCE